MKPENLSGIYRILNTVTGKCYIGSAFKFSARWRNHAGLLLNNKHHSIHLQAAYNKYGKDSFKFEILLACSKENLISFEQWAINTYNPEYNICKIAGSQLGYTHSDEAKAKMSAAKKGRKCSDETKAKIANANTGHKTSDETKEKISAMLICIHRNKSLLTIDIVRAIRLDWATKEFKARDLAIKYETPVHQIYNITYNRTWKEV